MKRLTLSQPEKQGMTFIHEIQLGIHGIQVGFTHSERMVLYYLAGLALPSLYYPVKQVPFLGNLLFLFFSSVHAQ
jgi:hypothetical protein